MIKTFKENLARVKMTSIDKLFDDWSFPIGATEVQKLYRATKTQSSVEITLSPVKSHFQI